ncbi:MAG TPA: tetratricopeptide repeat protein [Polyangiaceae bacterium]|jgi:tetratricopeptide (TPR) repeat protein|nr:MAG: bacteriophage N4 receptor, outer membrane subunit [Deltaproteobacteria bacterium ADurb.Bin207]HNS95924.1 tetratricopeptide repeat protein [Polyangiaceae bacterium]HNZ22543.1 tetratricopeptide repeat protein [Polyangiaceae bacterium]HOD23625.1 tetratricopeptide repeat protein [Polyangiaceae bacterium]HOE48549.1 tetratricopeptide repeat protein [Polyangiaceae bacterium]
MKLSTLCVMMFFGFVVALSGCGREKIEAVNLANEGTLLKKQGAYDAAIDKYEAATQLDPSNHEIIYMLATTYRKKEEWEKVASTLARATQAAPQYANYHYERGYALVQVASKSKQRSAWEEAKEPLVKCIEADTRFAHCYFELALVELFLDNEQGALENYTKAIQHAPNEGSFYAPLADLYIRLDYFDQAKGVLEQGVKFAADESKAKFNMYVLLASVAQFQNDMPSMVKALETANELGGKDNPEILFNLGSTYAVLNPPKKSQAIQMLKKFQAQACKGGSAQKYREQCEQAIALLVKLEGP